MRAITLTLRLSAGAGLLAFGFGCHTPDRPHTVSVGVFDAETHTPVAGAAVRLSSVRGNDVGVVNSGQNGVATLATGDKPPPERMFASVSAVGYLPNTAEVDLLAADSKPAKSPRVELFAGPAPKVVLTITTIYAGPVVLNFRTDPTQPAGRSFTATVDDTGAAKLVGPPVLDTLTPADVVAVYPDGKPVPTEASNGVALFQWVRTSGKTFTFYVGTPIEAEEFRKQLDEPLPSHGRQGPTDGSQRGGGGRRGGGGGRGGTGMGGIGGR